MITNILVESARVVRAVLESTFAPALGTVALPVHLSLLVDDVVEHALLLALIILDALTRDSVLDLTRAAQAEITRRRLLNVATSRKVVAGKLLVTRNVASALVGAELSGSGCRYKCRRCDNLNDS